MVLAKPVALWFFSSFLVTHFSFQYWPNRLPGDFFFFFSHTFPFQLPTSRALVTGVVPSSPPVLAFKLKILSRIGFSNPAARRFFTWCCSLTLSRFPQVNLCTRKSPHEFVQVCTREGLELTKLTYTRLEDNLIRHRGDRFYDLLVLTYRY